MFLGQSVSRVLTVSASNSRCMMTVSFTMPDSCTLFTKSSSCMCFLGSSKFLTRSSALGTSAGLSMTSLMSRRSSGMRSACVRSGADRDSTVVWTRSVGKTRTSVLYRLWKSSRASSSWPCISCTSPLR
ncbi:TPA: hypothetical protein BOS_13716 [Bos taurus]|nr:TPA: hypothetical protein BOS_13716 [Bos taurus]